MSIEDVATRVRRKLGETFDAEETSYLMDRPPGGWSDLVTRDVLHLELSSFRHELRGEMDVLRHELRGEMAALRGDLRTEMAALSASVDRRLRAQTWVVTSTVIAGMAAAVAAGSIG